MTVVLGDPFTDTQRSIYTAARGWDVHPDRRPWGKPVSRRAGYNAKGRSIHREAHAGLSKQFRTNDAVRLRRRFDSLVNEWLPAARYQSNLGAVAMTVPYQEMIAMGPATIPLILRRLAQGDAPYWLWALRMLAGENEAVVKAGGSMVEARDAWLEWGRAQGYLSSGVR